MSYWIAGAMVVSAIGGAVSSKNAADKNAKGVEKGLNQSMAVTNKARQDVISLFDNSAKKAGVGIESALDFYKQNALKRMQPAVQGNMMAQQVVGQGGIQANNAILGLPVDMSFANSPQQVPVDYAGISNAKLPATTGIMGEQLLADQPAESQPAANTEKNIAGFGGSGPFQGLTDKRRFDLVELGKNPLGLNDKNYKKIQPKNITKKVNKILGF